MMKIDWQVMAQDDENRLTSESAIWWRAINRWKEQYDNHRLTNESEKK